MRFIFWAFVFFMVGLFAWKFITEVNCEAIFFGAWFLISTSLCFKYKGEITIPIGILFFIFTIIAPGIIVSVFDICAPSYY